MASGKPMDRLICGDVGFGKTEVALRAAFIAAMAGSQVEIVVPTTLLSRQHYRSFTERFAGLPLRIGQLSRLVPAKVAREVKKELADGRLEDRKSTRLNSSHANISYAVFCLKKKKEPNTET